jgi:hypothetical protein|tara:strand:- start:499 stop:624 length:126 start_codon:yes stop_codon:yes gene_type:complete
MVAATDTGMVQHLQATVLQQVVHKIFYIEFYSITLFKLNQI